jgi:hypothetical protein
MYETKRANDKGESTMSKKANPKVEHGWPCPECNSTGETCNCDLSKKEPCPRFVEIVEETGLPRFDFAKPCKDIKVCGTCKGKGWLTIEDGCNANSKGGEATTLKLCTHESSGQCLSAPNTCEFQVTTGPEQTVVCGLENAALEKIAEIESEEKEKPKYPIRQLVGGINNPLGVVGDRGAEGARGGGPEDMEEKK